MKDIDLSHTQTFQYSAERFADLQLLRYRVDGFETLSLRQKELVFHLAEAALWGRDILWDQNGRCNLALRQLLEGIYMYFQGPRDTQEFLAFEVYLKRIWFSNGIHHHYGCDKFQPGFSREYMETLIAGSGLPQPTEELLDLIFCPDVMPKRVNQRKGDDLLLTSSCNYYQEGITQAEAEAFYQRLKEDFMQHPAACPHDALPQRTAAQPPMFGLNSQLVRGEDGTLQERVWCINGMYGDTLAHVVEHLEAALPFAENSKQEEVIRTLIYFYRTGNLCTFDLYSILWLQDTEGLVDFTNGFTEVYGDPLELKASWEGYVNFTDLEATHRTETMSREAQWFEDHSPVDARFKKEECHGVSAKVIKAAILGGDLYPSSAIGINLPNSQWIREQYGSKSVTIGNLTQAYNEAARGNGFHQEFVIDKDTLQLIDRYGNVCDDLHTDLHECLGHGSGRLLPGVDADALRAYGSTIEEARADLFALYYLADAKLVELGLTPDSEAYKAAYYTYLMNGCLTQLVRIEPGKQIEEAHMRNRSLIAHWVLQQHPEAAALVCRDGKHFLLVRDYALLRHAFASLLAEIQRIKSEGDFEAARTLVETYGIQVDPVLHQEVLSRYSTLHLAPYKGFINPRYEVLRDASGQLLDIVPHYDESFSAQMLRYSRDYSTLTPLR